MMMEGGAHEGQAVRFLSFRMRVFLRLQVIGLPGNEIFPTDL